MHRPLKHQILLLVLVTLEAPGTTLEWLAKMFVFLRHFQNVLVSEIRYNEYKNKKETVLLPKPLPSIYTSTQ